MLCVFEFEKHKLRINYVIYLIWLTKKGELSFYFGLTKR